MKEADAQSVVARAREHFNAHEFDDITQLMAEDVLWIAPDVSEPVHGRAEARGRFARFAGAMPDLHADLRNSFGGGEWVCEEWTVRGTFTKPFLTPQGETVPPTNKPIELDEGVIFRVVKGEIREIHVYLDTGSMAAQMGLSG